MKKSPQLQRVEAVSGQPKKKATRIIAFESLFRMMAEFNKEELKRLIDSFDENDYNTDIVYTQLNRKAKHIGLQIGRPKFNQLSIEIFPVIEVDREGDVSIYDYLTHNDIEGYAEWTGGGGTDGYKVRLP